MRIVGTNVVAFHIANDHLDVVVVILSVVVAPKNPPRECDRPLEDDKAIAYPTLRPPDGVVCAGAGVENVRRDLVVIQIVIASIERARTGLSWRCAKRAGGFGWAAGVASKMRVQWNVIIGIDRR